MQEILDVQFLERDALTDTHARVCGMPHYRAASISFVRSSEINTINKEYHAEFVT